MFHVEQLMSQLMLEAASLGIAIDKHAAEAMLIHLELLERWNAKLNLVGPGLPGTWLTRHTLDSLVPAPAIPDGAEVLDVGSGAGFPGIPLALARPNCAIWLSERRAKRRAFQQNVIAAVGARNARVVVEPAPDQRFDVVLGRAVLPPLEWLRSAAALVRPSGKVGLFAQVGAADLAALGASAGLHLENEIAYVLANESRRFAWFHLVPRGTHVNSYG